MAQTDNHTKRRENIEIYAINNEIERSNEVRNLRRGGISLTAKEHKKWYKMGSNKE